MAVALSQSPPRHPHADPYSAGPVTPLLRRAEGGGFAGSFSSADGAAPAEQPPPPDRRGALRRLDVGRLRKRLAATLATPFWQKVVMGAILADSCVVLLECITDAALDERRDTWFARGGPREDTVGAMVHLGYVLKHILQGLATALTLSFIFELSARAFAYGSGILRRPVYLLDMAVVVAACVEESLAPYVGPRLEHSLSLVLRVAYGVYLLMLTREQRLVQELSDARDTIAALERELRDARRSRRGAGGGKEPQRRPSLARQHRGPAPD
eukprot:TRINITY_DN13775_c0_g1_i2.p1 TRINITY_DN13775_c0_g1~~TRINITY_DN13775_c0_g1_i2.p1  ORF type:complete len:270 (+),score=88.17 TRINITY_DN13775_c0_g1_i2:98-907(+)